MSFISGSRNWPLRLRKSVSCRSFAFRLGDGVIVSFHGGSPFQGFRTRILCESGMNRRFNFQLGSRSALRDSLDRVHCWNEPR
jgi:hypothetical protein